MEFRKFDNNYVIRIDKGEEIITSLTKLCKEEDISLAISKNFTFDAWGMGKVFNWNEAWNNWDNMQGVCFNWSNYLWTC